MIINIILCICVTPVLIVHFYKRGLIEKELNSYIAEYKNTMNEEDRLKLHNFALEKGMKQLCGLVYVWDGSDLLYDDILKKLDANEVTNMTFFNDRCEQLSIEDTKKWIKDNFFSHEEDDMRYYYYFFLDNPTIDVVKIRPDERWDYID